MDRTKKNIVELTRTTVERYSAAPKLPLVLVLDNVRSMQNVGSLLRTSDAFMVREVVMAGITGVPPHPDISKSALGAEESVRWRHVDSAADECLRLRAEEGAVVCVLEQTRNSVRLGDYIPPDGKLLVLVVGNEVEGVGQNVVDLSDVCLEIEQWGVKHSLNVAVSGAIALWELSRRVNGRI